MLWCLRKCKGFIAVIRDVKNVLWKPQQSIKWNGFEWSSWSKKIVEVEIDTEEYFKFVLFTTFVIFV